MKKKRKQTTFIQCCIYFILAICCIVSIIFVTHNQSFYKRPIAKVTQTKVTHTSDIKDEHHNKDKLFTQHITAKLMNGKEKGRTIHMTNTYSASHAYDLAYQAGNELFLTIHTSKGKNQPIIHIQDVKRDTSIVIAGWAFLLILLAVGKKQGLLTAVSLVLNAILLTWAINLYVSDNSLSLLWICGIVAVLFTVISLLLINGVNEKSYAAIIATLLGTGASLLIMWIVMKVTSENGLHYEEMQFLTRPYKLVFFAGLFIGSLGAVMDVAITMSASIFELYQKNNTISMNALKKSGMDIGKDIMGTMTNILFFAYISGSIPMIILYLKNASPLGFTLSMNLSLELARALAGGIGIVLTIPIGLYSALFFVRRKQAKS